MAYKAGDTLRLHAQFKNFDGDEFDGDTILLQIFEDPSMDPIEKSGAQIANTSTGAYHYDYETPAEPGHIRFEFTAVKSGVTYKRGGHLETVL